MQTYNGLDQVHEKITYVHLLFPGADECQFDEYILLYMHMLF